MRAATAVVGCAWAVVVLGALALAGCQESVPALPPGPDGVKAVAATTPAAATAGNPPSAVPAGGPSAPAADWAQPVAAEPVSPARAVAPVSADTELAGSFISPVALRELGLRNYWQSRLALVDGDEVRMVRLLGDNLVVLTQKNMCYAVDTTRGFSRVLAQVLPETVPVFIPPAFDGTHYYFTAGLRAVGVNDASGAVDIQVKLELPSTSQAISDKTFLYTGASDGKVFAYSLATQVKHWNSKLDSGVTSLGFSRGSLIIARSDARKGRGELVALRPKLWTEVWSQFTDGPITAPVGCTEEAIFVASEDGSLYRFNAEQGWSEWRVRTPGVLTEGPVLLSDTVVQNVPGSGVWHIGKVKGDVLWKDPAALQFLGQAGERMYFFDGRRLVCKEASTGKALGAAAVRDPGSILTVANPDNTRLYFVDRTGTVFCYNDLGQPYLVIGR